MNNSLDLPHSGSSFDSGYANYLAYLGFANKQSTESTSLETELPKWLVSKDHISVLDIGGGNGHLSAVVRDISEAKSRNLDMTILDPASASVEKIRHVFFDDARTDVIQTSFQTYIQNVNGKQFDLVFASHVVYYFEDRREFFRSMLELLAPGGLLCCIAGTVSLFQHSLYQELLPDIWRDSVVQRSFAVDGYGGCAEELELIAFNEGRIFTSVEVPSSVSFTAEDVRLGAEALLREDTYKSNGFCMSLEFLFRTPIEVIFSKREAVFEYLTKHRATETGIEISCADKLMFLRNQQGK
jgi:SAM-dependent methyltransferase